MLRCTSRVLGAAASTLPAVHSFQLDEALEAASDADPVFAQWNGTVFRYMCFPGATPDAVHNHLLRLPLFDRMVHTVFGRPDTPVDIAIDIDGKVPAGVKTDLMQTLLVNATLESMHRELETMNLRLERQLILQSVYTNRVSMHVHARLADDAAFADYRHLAEFVAKVKNGIRVPGDAPEASKDVFASAIDLNIYRRNGTLRIFNSVNTKQTSPLHVVPNTAKTKHRQDWHIGDTGPLSAIEASLVVRPPLFVDSIEIPGAVTVQSAPRVTKAVSGEASPASGGGFALSTSYTTDINAPTVREMPQDPRELLRIAAAAAPLLTPEMAHEYRGWISVYIHMKKLITRLEALGVPRDESDPVLGAAFHQFSRLAPDKYDEREVSKKWRRFDANLRAPDDVDPRAGVVFLLRRCTRLPDIVSTWTPGKAVHVSE